ncbi:MAG: CsbD family protein [Paralcaligenes sp.]
MSQPGIDKVGDKCEQQVSGAKIASDNLTEDETLTLEVHASKLIQLTQEHYGVSRDVAERQINGFFERLSK